MNSEFQIREFVVPRIQEFVNFMKAQGRIRKRREESDWAVGKDHVVTLG